jgi:hypothetical protein
LSWFILYILCFVKTSVERPCLLTREGNRALERDKFNFFLSYSLLFHLNQGLIK